MPELPEVETIKGQLQKFIVGKKLAGLEVRFPRLVRPLSPSEASQKTVGAKIVTVGRHGKYLLLSLDNGQVLVIHLRLTGQLHYFASEAPPMGTRIAAIFAFADGSSLFFTDLRGFGTMQLLAQAELQAFLDERTGIDCLDPRFTPDYFWQKSQKTKRALKAFLLDQKHFTGVGNIYADEALHQAKLSPLKITNTLKRDQSDRLHQAIMNKLRMGIKLGGASVSDYEQVTGEKGTMQTALKVYGRRGQPCGYCGAPLSYLKVGGRGTVYCPHCQP